MKIMRRLLILLCLSALFFGAVMAKAQDTPIFFTDEEKDWKARHHTLRLGVGIAFPPFMWVEKENGQHLFKGMVSDYVDLLGEKLGMDMQIVFGISFDEALALGKVGRIDVFPCISRTPERSEFLLFTEPYLSYPLVIITQEGAPIIAGVKDLEGKRFATVKHLVVYSRMINKYSHLNINYVFTKKVEESLEAVSLGRADACIINLGVASYYIQKKGLANLRIAAPINWEGVQFSMGVRKDWPILQNILEKGLSSISQEEKDRISQKWIQAKYDPGVPIDKIWRWSLGIGLSVFVIFVLIYAWNRRLRKEIVERQKAENDLEESKRKLTILIGNLPGIAYRCLNDKKWTMTYISDGCKALTGYKPSELIENRVLAYSDLIVPEDRLNIWNEVQMAIRENRSFTIEYRIQDKNKNEKWVWEKGRCVAELKGGNPVIEGFISDITERKRAEKTIRENESYMRSVFRAAPAGIGVVHDRIFSQVNNKFCEMLGYSQEELIGQSARFVYPDDEKYKRVGIDKYQQISQSGTGSVETQFVCKDGRIIDVLLSSTPIEIDNLEAGVTFTALDITSFKNTQAALKRSETKYRKMMEAIKDPIYICSDDFIIQYMNQAMIDRIGHDATGKLCYEALHGFNKQCQWCKYYKTFLMSHTGKNILSPLDNRSFHVSSTIFENENGSLSKLSVFRDTTELIELQTRLQQAQKMEAIGNLAGGIAHDFNNILFPIIGMSEMMMEDLPTGSMEQEYAHGIHKAGHRAKELVSQILAFSRQSDQEKMPVRFQNILEEVLKLCQSTIPANIKIEHKIQQDCGSIHGNSTQLHQIAMNLITNAYHAVEKKNGKISVGLEEIKIDRINFPDILINSGNYLLFTVSDDGTGMTDNVKEKIFEPYFTTKEQGRGTGLGLAMVYGIVNEYGGEIEVKTEIGSGTTFRIYLPLIGESENQGAAETKTKLETGHEHILLVDDEATVIKLEQQMLERLGYQVTSCNSSLEAIEVFHSNPDAFDIIITDMTMPNMTGDQVAKNILSIKPDTPIIIITGFSERINKEKAETIGIKGFLMKPVLISDMAQMVRNVLDEPQKPS